MVYVHFTAAFCSSTYTIQLHCDKFFFDVSRTLLTYFATETILVTNAGTVNAEIFLVTIFRGLSFCGDKFLWVSVTHHVAKNAGYACFKATWHIAGVTWPTGMAGR